MRDSLLLMALAAGVVSGCDEQAQDDSSAGCIIGVAGGSSEIWLLPTAEEAKRLATAEKRRNQGTVNLLLAKYDKASVRAGTRCERLEIVGEFVKVRVVPTGPSGWVPGDQLKSE